MDKKKYEDSPLVKRVIENLGTKFGFTYKISETAEELIITFFDGKEPFGEVTLKKRKI